MSDGDNSINWSLTNGKKETSGHLAPLYDMTLNTDWTQINQLSKQIPLWRMFHRESLFFVTVQRDDGRYRLEHVAFHMSSYSYISRGNHIRCNYVILPHFQVTKLFMIIFAEIKVNTIKLTSWWVF